MLPEPQSDACIVQRLGSRLERSWRIFATGFAFAALGIGGLLLANTLFPLISLATPDVQRRHDRARAAVRAGFRFYVAGLRLLRVINLEVDGADRLRLCRGHLIVSNHPTLLDVVLIIALVPRAQCVVKHQLWRNPFLRGVVRATGYIRNDLATEDFVEACRASLADGNNLIIFPEGTRSVPGRLPRFQRGFANIATLTSADIQLITITCNPITLTKGAAWYDIPVRRASFHVSAGHRVDVADLLREIPRPQVARNIARDLEAYYAERLSYGRP